jgi:hypothetical protein
VFKYRRNLIAAKLFPDRVSPRPRRGWVGQAITIAWPFIYDRRVSLVPF